jgi:hypothetical protein
MSFELFNTNADICTKMAASAKSNEVRDQWKELATHWRSKAHASEPNAPAAGSESIKPLDVSPLTSSETPVHRLQAEDREKRGSKAPLAEICLLPSVAPSLAPHDEKSALDEIWQALQPKKSAAIAPTTNYAR